MSPLRIFRMVAIAEAVTWALLLVGMTLKYATDTTDLGVRIAGPIHGVVFIAYCLTTALVALDQRWSRGRLLGGLLSSIPPFVTIAFDRYAEGRGILGERWRLRADRPGTASERAAAWLVRNPGRGAVAGVAAVAVLTVVALAVGPPGS